MGFDKFLAAILLVSAFPLLLDAASPRVLLATGVGGDETPNSDKVAAQPTTLSPPPKSDLSKEHAQSSLAVQNPGHKNRPESPTPANLSPPGDNSTNSAQLRVPEKTSSHDSPPNSAPPNAPENNSQQGRPVSVLPPNEVEAKKPPVPSNGGEGKNDKDVKESEAPPEVVEEHGAPPMDKIQEPAEEEMCDVGSEECHVGEELFACLQVSRNASNELFVVVRNKGQNVISVDVKPTPSIVFDETKLELAKNGSRKLKVLKRDSTGGEIILTAGKGDCILHVKKTASDWQQPFQQFTAYATRLTPIYAAYFFVFTVVLVGAVWACCKFTRGRRVDAGAQYQQLEMGAQVQTSSAVAETTSTADGWDDGWDDDWDDEEATARPLEKNPTVSVAMNGLSSRSRNNSKNGWDVDWDD